MEAALSSLLGRHDFMAFCHREGRVASTVRTVEQARIRPWSDGVIVDIQADAFLHRMMRLVVANVVAIGRSEQPISWLEDLLQSRNRHLAGQEAPACGLFLMRIGYSPTVLPWWESVLEKSNHEELLG
jgi:tRNA pseudouridine38-40 synthase